MQPTALRISCLKELCFLVLLIVHSGTIAQLQPAIIFSDHMVLQRDKTVPVWGTAAPEEQVVVKFNGREYPTRADKKGSWQALLLPEPAGGPFEMDIQGEEKTVRFSDILMGDIWLCSGQSNMEWTVGNSNEAQMELKNGNHPEIRHFKVPLSSALLPEPELAGGQWEVASPETVGNFTAVGYFFARKIVMDMDIPIGLINSSWGGSRIEPWIRAEDLGYEDPAAMAAEIAARKTSEQAAFTENLKKKLPDIPKQDLGMEKDKALWADPGLEDEGWSTMELPSLWELKGWDGIDGIFWFRKTIVLGKEFAEQPATLSLGTIDDSDQAWVNGQLVGTTNQAYNKERNYDIPTGHLTEGHNTIVIRVEDTGGGGGVYGDPQLLFLEAGGKQVPLSGEWKFKVGMVQLNGSQQSDNQQPTLLYNKMIYPLLKFPLKGVLWYQGESNAGDDQQALAYADLFKTLITSWRTLWNQGDFPFLYVQLANFMEPLPHPSESSWALLRESQSKALGLPSTAQAVVIDIGEAGDIHPRNKQDVGKRLAFAAEHIAYGRKVVFSGPVFKEMELREGVLELSFDHTGGGLVTREGEPLQGFSIAAEDGNYTWADARISGDKVLLSAKRVINPVAVRYAWADNPEKANLYNREGFPASPFQSSEMNK